MDATTFATQEGFATELVRNLRSRSYAVIELPIEASDAVNALLSETDVFFGASCAAERASLSHLPFAEDGTPTYRGTAETAARSMLFVRLTSGAPGVQPLPAALPSLPRASRLLHEVSLALLRAVAIGLNLMPDVLVDLADPMPNPPASERAAGLNASRTDSGLKPCGNVKWVHKRISQADKELSAHLATGSRVLCAPPFVFAEAVVIHRKYTGARENDCAALPRPRVPGRGNRRTSPPGAQPRPWLSATCGDARDGTRCCGCRGVFLTSRVSGRWSGKSGGRRRPRAGRSWR